MSMSEIESEYTTEISPMSTPVNHELSSPCSPVITAAPETSLTPEFQQLAHSPSKRPAFDLVFRTTPAKRSLTLTPSQR
jgi:hypothetical protein